MRLSLEKIKILTESIKSPKELVDFLAGSGRGHHPEEKKEITTFCIETKGFSREEIKQERLDNPILKKINSKRALNRYHEKAEKTEEFVKRKNEPVTKEDMKLFRKLRTDKVSDEDIAKMLGRTISAVMYLKKLERKKKEEDI